MESLTKEIRFTWPWLMLPSIGLRQIQLIAINNMSRFWSKSIHDLTPYTPGEQPQIENLIKLNTNENPYGPSPRVIEAIKTASEDDLRKYPDPNAGELKTTIANNFGLGADQVFVGNSSDEVLAHAFRAFFVRDEALLMPDITYSFYPVWCQFFDIDHQAIPLREDFTLDVNDYNSPNGGIIFANPNAPTGIALPLVEIDKILRSNTDSVVLVDEAYVDFAKKSALSLIDSYPNLLVVQTLSKSRSLAGLRVGFACGNAELIEGLERVKNSFHPYALDRLSIAGAVASINDVAYFKETCEKVIATRESSATKLTELGFSVLPSQANFLMAKHSSMAAAELFSALREKNIVVRYFSTPRIDEYIRISIGTDDEMTSLFIALAEILSVK